MGKALLILHVFIGSTFRVGKLFTGSKFWILAIYNDDTFFSASNLSSILVILHGQQ